MIAHVFQYCSLLVFVLNSFSCFVECNTNILQYPSYLYDSDDDTSDNDTTASFDSSSNASDDKVDYHTDRNSNLEINECSTNTTNYPKLGDIDDKPGAEIPDNGDTEADANIFKASTVVATKRRQKGKTKCEG